MVKFIFRFIWYFIKAFIICLGTWALIGAGYVSWKAVLVMKGD